MIACEPASCPTLTKGPYVYDFGDTAGKTPLLRHVFPRPCLHARPHPRGRPALSRDGAPREQAARRRADRGEGLRCSPRPSARV